jgi:phosphotransferase system enzyme I (PtsI)
VTEGSEEIWLRGRAIVPGVAIGSPFLLTQICVGKEERARVRTVSVEDEVQRFLQAVAQSQEELRVLSEKLRDEGFRQEADLVDSHVQMAGDPTLCQEIETVIRQTERRAECVVEEMVEKLRIRFEKLPDAIFRQRFEDVEGVCHRILSVLETGLKGPSQIEIPRDAILFAKTVTAPIAAEVSVNGVGAIVTSHGGSMSHTAIVARARGIPYITDIEMSNVGGISAQDAVIVDGSSGVVIFRPKEETIKNYTRLKKAHEIHFTDSSLALRRETRTKDGTRITLLGNVSGVQDVRQLSKFGLDGVGLYRTEYLVLERRRFPSEQEQTEAYLEMAKAAEGKPIVIRVFDFGSDKCWDEVAGVIPAIKQGRRATSLLLDHPQIFLAHLRAIVRACTQPQVSILFPMIASVEELDRALRLLRDAWLAARSEHRLLYPKVGAMIELPSVAFSTAKLAAKLDFISIGTNDLVQYSLAVDRSSNAFFDHRLAFHPGLLHLLKLIVDEGKKANVPVCLCGEMASDPLFVPFLLGLGIRQLSIAPRLAPVVQDALQMFSVAEAEQIAKKVLACSSAENIFSFLQEMHSKTENLSCDNTREVLEQEFQKSSYSP